MNTYELGKSEGSSLYLVKKNNDVIKEFEAGSYEGALEYYKRYVEDDKQNDIVEEMLAVKKKIDSLSQQQMERYALVARKSLNDIYKDLISTTIQFSYNNLAESVEVGNFSISRKDGKVSIIFKTEL